MVEVEAEVREVEVVVVIELVERLEALVYVVSSSSVSFFGACFLPPNRRMSR